MPSFVVRTSWRSPYIQGAATISGMNLSLLMNQEISEKLGLDKKSIKF